MDAKAIRNLTNQLYETNASLGPFIDQLNDVLEGNATQLPDPEELFELLMRMDSEVVALFCEVYKNKPKFWQFWK